MRLVLATLIGVAAAHVQVERKWTLGGAPVVGVLEETSSPEALPGLCDSVNQSAGYFKISGTKNAHYFYWFFESRSEPKTDPVILWMTGGPGCSSGIALFHENGPCKINSDFKTTTPNPYSWNSNASIVFIDQPVGVGFSYGDAADDLHDEAGVAEDMYQFLHAFSAANGDILKNNPFFIFGESYGGHYAPATADRVGQSLNLRGLGVGNGLTNPLVQYKYYAQMAFNYTQSVTGQPAISLESYREMESAMPQCESMIRKCQVDTDSCSEAQGFCNQAMLGPYEQTGLNPYDVREKCKVPPLCYDFSDVKSFLDTPAVQSALGVTDSISWQSCNFTVNAAFKNDWMKSMAGHVPPLLGNSTRVLIYAGDVDFICNWLGNQAWTLALDWPHADAFNAEGTHIWSVGSAQAGEARTSNGFTFLRVDSAGHMVPLDKPKNALAMVNTFMAGGKFY